MCIVSVYELLVNNSQGGQAFWCWYTVCMLPEVPFSQIASVILSLVVSLGFHEAMHAFVAHRLGDNTAAGEGRLTLNPLKHIDMVMTVILPLGMMLMGLPPILIARPVPFDPNVVRYGEYGAAMVALAGPFTNLGLAVIGVLVVRIGLFAGPLFAELLGTFIVVNVSLFVFNMLPIPPLDGSRLLYAFAPEPLQRLMAQIEAMGFFALVVILVVVLPVLGPVITTANEAVLLFLL